MISFLVLLLSNRCTHTFDMRFLVILALFEVIAAYPNTIKKYHQFFNPENYMDQLPNLSMPYIDNIPLPELNIPPINPSPVVTKVINVITKYVNKNPVCIKVTRKKPFCAYKDDTKNTLDYLVTKEYFVRDPQPQSSAPIKRRIPLISNKTGKRKSKPKTRNTTIKSLVRNHDINIEIEGGETARVVTKISQTPPLNLSETKIRDILIEDRLDHLEGILPYYKRRKLFQTSTLTVTKVRYNSNKATATLIVKNCVPPDIAICPNKKKRKTKEMRFNGEENYDENNYRLI